MNDRAVLMAADAKVVRVANALVAGDLAFLDGVRQLVELRARVSSQSHDPDFMLFVAIDSQADHIPPTQTRELRAPAWCDKDASELENLYINDVKIACAQWCGDFRWVADEKQREHGHNGNIAAGWSVIRVGHTDFELAGCHGHCVP